MKNVLIQRDLIEKQLTQKHNGTNEGLFVRGRMNERSFGGKNKSRSKSRLSNKVKTCHCCRLKGHLKKDCWKFKRMQQEKKSKESTFSDASYVNNSDDAGALVVTHGFKGDKESILDLGCSFNMTPHAK